MTVFSCDVMMFCCDVMVFGYNMTAFSCDALFVAGDGKGTSGGPGSWFKGYIMLYQ